MKWDYSIKLEVDTNDGDYINETCDLGTYDDEDEADGEEGGFSLDVKDI